MEKIPRTRSGFTLIELSIVLVIIGLIVGGVMVGQDLIKSALLRSVITDTEKIKTAINAFRDKYNCLPGDCANATNFFSGSTNGNGNEYLARWQLGGAGNVDYTESYQAWRQLALAGLISGTFTGSQGAGGVRDTQIGTNIPALRIGKAGINIYSIEYMAGPSANGRWGLYLTAQGNQFYIGQEATYAGVSTVENDGPFLKPIDAYTIDSKIDDGLPGSGTTGSIFDSDMVVSNGAAFDCASTNNFSTATYKTTITTLTCSMFMKTGF